MSRHFLQRLSEDRSRNLSRLARNPPHRDYFRAPLRGSSLSKQPAPFNPRNYSRRLQHESVFASIVAAGEAIAEGLPPDLKSKVPVPIHRVVALSDLPMEWTMIDGDPRHEGSVNAMLDQVIAWGGALKTLRER